jgi:hypothetical protein
MSVLSKFGRQGGDGVLLLLPTRAAHNYLISDTHFAAATLRLDHGSRERAEAGEFTGKFNDGIHGSFLPEFVRPFD